MESLRRTWSRESRSIAAKYHRRRLCGKTRPWTLRRRERRFCHSKASSSRRLWAWLGARSRCAALARVCRETRGACSRRASRFFLKPASEMIRSDSSRVFPSKLSRFHAPIWTIDGSPKDGAQSPSRLFRQHSLIVPESLEKTNGILNTVVRCTTAVPRARSAPRRRSAETGFGNNPCEILNVEILSIERPWCPWRRDGAR